MNKIKKWGYIITVVVCLSLLISPHSFAKDKKDPVEITSDRMRSEDGGLKIIFSGNVEGYWGDLKITCDILEVYNTPDKKETEEIVAIGNVFITRGLKRAKGDKAIYLDNQSIGDDGKVCKRTSIAQNCYINKSLTRQRLKLSVQKAGGT